MPANSDKPERWKRDIAISVDFYNKWFMKFAPKVYRDTRVTATEQVELALEWTANLTNLNTGVLRAHPEILEMLRMATAPPIARDRLIGLSQASPTVIRAMELDHTVPTTMKQNAVDSDLENVCKLIRAMADLDIFPWLDSALLPTAEEMRRASTIVADRLCGAQSDPIVRNAQEERQLAAIRTWLETRGYTEETSRKGLDLKGLRPGTFLFRFNVPVKLPTNAKGVNIPVDAAVMPRPAKPGQLPILVEAKSAGDFTNPNKRRKEEATKISQLKRTYGNRVQYILFLCGYFDSGYLRYEAAEGIDWVWEHRMDDLLFFGL